MHGFFFSLILVTKKLPNTLAIHKIEDKGIPPEGKNNYGIHF